MKNSYRSEVVGHSWLLHMKENPDSYHIRYSRHIVGSWLRQQQRLSAVIEVGCGSGYLSQLPELQGCRYFGTDDSEIFIQQAKLRYNAEKTEFIKMDFLADAPIEVFDHIFSVMVWSEFSDLNRAFIQLKNSLKPAGKALLVLPSFGHPELWSHRGKLLDEKTLELQYGHPNIGSETLRIYLHTEKDLQQACQLAGLKCQVWLDPASMLLSPEKTSPYSAVEVLNI